MQRLADPKNKKPVYVHSTRHRRPPAQSEGGLFPFEQVRKSEKKIGLARCYAEQNQLRTRALHSIQRFPHCAGAITRVKNYLPKDQEF
jgi:hypothetical protein